MLVLLFGAVMISSSPVFAKLAAQAGLGTTATGFWRSFLGGFLLLGVALARGRSLRLPSRSAVFGGLAGIVFFVDLFAWHRAIVYVGAGMSTVLGNTQVFATAVLSFFVFRERLSPTFLTAATVAFVGVTLLVGVGSAGISLTGRYAQGVALGLLTGIMYAAFLIFLKLGQAALEESDLVAYFAWSTLVSAVGLGLLAWLEDDRFVPASTVEVVSVVALAALSQTIGWLAITSALPFVVTARAGLVLLSQPTLAMVWGWIFFAERLAPLQIAGALVTLTAMYVGITSRQPR